MNILITKDISTETQIMIKYLIQMDKVDAEFERRKKALEANYIKQIANKIKGNHD